MPACRRGRRPSRTVGAPRSACAHARWPEFSLASPVDLTNARARAPDVAYDSPLPPEPTTLSPSATAAAAAAAAAASASSNRFGDLRRTDITPSARPTGAAAADAARRRLPAWPATPAAAPTAACGARARRAWRRLPTGGGDSTKRCDTRRPRTAPVRMNATTRSNCCTRCRVGWNARDVASD